MYYQFQVFFMRTQDGYIHIFTAMQDSETETWRSLAQQFSEAAIARVCYIIVYTAAWCFMQLIIYKSLTMSTAIEVERLIVTMNCLLLHRSDDKIYLLYICYSRCRWLRYRYIVFRK